MENSGRSMVYEKSIETLANNQTQIIINATSKNQNNAFLEYEMFFNEKNKIVKIEPEIQDQV
jgi:hypothetical protein